MVNATAVDRALGNRLRLLDQLQDYMETVKPRKLSGTSKEAAKILASRKLILKIRKEAGLEDVDMDGFIPEFDLGSRSQRVDDWEDVTIPRFEEATDEEWMVLLSQLLASSLQLKETCLKLSGVVYMIEHLHGLGTEIILFFFACVVDAGDELTRGGGRLQTARLPEVCASDEGFGARFCEQDCDEVWVSLWNFVECVGELFEEGGV
ncbi:hypothetical protein HFD88_005581 [Aspergillus terreus]|nr:hypothetical protein HFD88_005581 [Aspergillus terreus]